MSNLDSKVAAVLDNKSSLTTEEDEDDLISQLENDNDNVYDNFREQRLQQLHAEIAREKQLRNQEHGSYSEVKEEKKLMELTTSSKLCIVHFFKHDFNRCRIMDSHLETLAPLHLDTRFLKIDVTNAAFLVVKLKVQVLPCVIAFIDGKGVDRIVGFEGLGKGTDHFSTRTLEARLVQSGVLIRSKLSTGAPLTRATKVSYHQDGSDDDDWD